MVSKETVSKTFSNHTDSEWSEDEVSSIAADLMKLPVEDVVDLIQSFSSPDDSFKNLMTGLADNEALYDRVYKHMSVLDDEAKQRTTLLLFLYNQTSG